MKPRVLLLALVLLVLAGCSKDFKADTFSINDIGISSISNPDKKVVYNMTRPDAEKILGTGELEAGMYKYKNGVSVFYREDRIAGISINDESKDFYKSIRGASIGMLKGEIADLYGQKNILEPTKGTLDYVYNLNTKKYLSKEEYGRKRSEDESEKNILFQAQFNTNGYADRYWLTDEKMAKLLK